MKDTAKDVTARIEGMFLIVDHGNISGLNRWVDELEKRRIPAVIKVDKKVADSNDGLVRSIADRGFEIGGGVEQPMWDESYKCQYENIKGLYDKIYSCTGKPLRIFSTKYFAYDETTLKVADNLAIEYVLARGTAGARSIVYKPREYLTKIISVSNVPSQKLGTGSLCDESLFSRGETPDDFRRILLNLAVDRIVLVAQTHLSGIKLRWWQVYQDFLNTNAVVWKSLDEFATNPVELPNAQIPTNREVKYVTPQPKIPLEQEPECPS